MRNVEFGSHYRNARLHTSQLEDEELLMEVELAEWSIDPRIWFEIKRRGLKGRAEELVKRSNRWRIAL